MGWSSTAILQPSQLSIHLICHSQQQLARIRLSRIAPDGARDSASCGTTRIIIRTGRVLSAAIQSPPPPRTPTPPALVSFFASLLLNGHKMMQSICLDNEPDADNGWLHVEQGYAGLTTPSTVSDHAEGENNTRGHGYGDSDEGSDEEYGGSTAVQPKKKKGGYDSRIEQILYENPDLPILIVDAGKSVESGGKYIVYTIRTGVSL